MTVSYSTPLHNKSRGLALGITKACVPDSCAGNDCERVEQVAGAAGEAVQPCPQQTGPTHGFHQCGIKPTGLNSINPYISSPTLHMLETSLCLYMALLLVELTLT
jgi:hypothetical protein